MQVTPASLGARSTEGEGVGLDARVKETDLEGVVGNFSPLPDELVEALTADDPRTLSINIRSVTAAGRLAADGNLEPDTTAGFGAKHDGRLGFSLKILKTCISIASKESPM